MAVILTLRATLARLTQQQLHAAVEPQVFSKGSAYDRGGRVTRLTVHGVSLNAFVSGSRAQPYRVECVERGGQLRGSCSCPYARDWALPCKHLVAALLAWMAQRDRGAIMPPALSRRQRRLVGAFALSLPLPRAAAASTKPPRQPRRRAAPPPLRPFLRNTPAWMISPRSPILGQQTEPWTAAPMAWLFAGDFFSGSGSLRAEVNLTEDAAFVAGDSDGPAVSPPGDVSHPARGHSEFPGAVSARAGLSLERSGSGVGATPTPAGALPRGGLRPRRTPGP